MKDKMVWIDMTKAPRDQVEQCFLGQRDEIIARIIRFQGELQSYNENRFIDNPIIMSMDFTEQLDKFLAHDDEDRSRLYARAFDLLRAIEE